MTIHSHIDGEARNPLAFLDGFFELYHIKMLFFSKIENKRAGLGIICRCPTGLFIAICQMAGLVERIAPCRVSFYQSSCRIVHTVELVQGLAEFFQTGHIGLRKFSVLTGWNIEQKRGATADRFEVNVHQFAQGLRLLIVMVEPAGANRNIGFSHRVLLPFWIPVIEVAIRWIVADLIRIDLLPNRISGNPLFISNPTNIGRLS